jgi:hypothetical protein
MSTGLLVTTAVVGFVGLRTCTDGLDWVGLTMIIGLPPPQDPHFINHSGKKSTQGLLNDKSLTIC